MATNTERIEALEKANKKLASINAAQNNLLEQLVGTARTMAEHPENLASALQVVQDLSQPEPPAPPEEPTEETTEEAGEETKSE